MRARIHTVQAAERASDGLAARFLRIRGAGPSRLLRDDRPRHPPPSVFVLSRLGAAAEEHQMIGECLRGLLGQALVPIAIILRPAAALHAAHPRKPVPALGASVARSLHSLRSAQRNELPIWKDPSIGNIDGRENEQALPRGRWIFRGLSR